MRITQTLGAIRFYFEIHDRKLDNHSRLNDQLNGIMDFLIQRYKLSSGFVDITTGLVDDQILRNKVTLRLSFPKDDLEKDKHGLYVHAPNYKKVKREIEAHEPREVKR